MADLDKPSSSKLDHQAKIRKQTEEFLSKGGKVDVQGIRRPSSTCDRCNNSLFNTARQHDDKVFCSDRCVLDYKAGKSGGLKLKK